MLRYEILSESWYKKSILDEFQRSSRVDIDSDASDILVAIKMGLVKISYDRDTNKIAFKASEHGKAYEKIFCKESDKD